MTPNFAEQAKEQCGACKVRGLNRTHTCSAFLAGCEHGYRVGKAERNCSVELTCEGGIFECQKEQIEKERDQLKARLAECEAALRNVSAGRSQRIARSYFAQHTQDGAKGDL